MQTIQMIVRKERDNNGNCSLVGFMPNSEANYGNIECFSFLDGHNEASLEYYRVTEKASLEEQRAFVEKYIKHLEWLKLDFNVELKQRLNMSVLRENWK